MNRRLFLQRLAALVAAGNVYGLPLKAAGVEWKRSFDAALRENPWLLGFQGISGADFPKRRLALKGKLPEALRGTFYRNGPAQHEIGAMRYHHWFDGDGMVHAFRFDAKGVSHQGRWVQTQKRKEEAQKGRALIQGFGTAITGMRSPRNADELNVANINIIQHNRELLALWEGGSAYRLDADTLTTLGLKSWSESTAGLPFGAHPRLDLDGTLWNIGYAAVAGALVIYKIGANGRLAQTQLVAQPHTPMIHDFALTHKHLVLLMPPFKFVAEKKGSFLHHFQWMPELGTRILIIDKNNLSTIKELQLPPMWIFHFSNAYENQDGTIHFGAPVYATPSIMTETFAEVMRGKVVASDQPTYRRFLLNPKTGAYQINDVEGAGNTEFPRYDLRQTCLRHRYTYMMQSNRSSPLEGFDALLRFDERTGALQRHTFSSTEMAEEHVFVPDPRSDTEDKGWLVGTSLDYQAAHSILNVFDAQHVSNGPVARMIMDYPIPLGLHGNFYPA